MKVLLFLFLTFGLQCTTGKISVVQTCPETKAAWDQRSSMFACVKNDTKYHCVMTSTWILVEACITPLNILENGGSGNGCPTVYLFESKAFWMFPLTQCSAQNAGCPRKGNGNYSTDELFKYPACFLNISERTSGGVVVQQTTKPTSTNRVSMAISCEHWEDFCRYDVVYLPYLCIGILVLIATLFIGIIRLNVLVDIRLKGDMAKQIKNRCSQSSIDSTGSSNRNGKVLLMSGNNKRKF